VKRWLVAKEAIAADRLATRGAGATRPVADNATEAGRQKNRRVEVVIRKTH
jgi:OOP family OmpA-OmpF porin